MMIHLSNTPLTNGAVMSSERLNAKTSRTPIDNLTGMSSHLLDILGRSVTKRHGPRVSTHGSGVRAEREEGERMKHDRVEQRAQSERRGQNHDEEHDELGVEDERPRDAHAHEPAHVLDAPRDPGWDWPGALAARPLAAVLIRVVA